MWERLNRHHGNLSTHFKEYFRSFTFDERVKQLKKKDLLALFVAEKGSTDIGYCIASIEGGKGEVDSIFIDSKYQNQGVGKHLIAEAESWLRNHYVDKVQIAVAEGNESSFGFYETRGYQHRFSVLEKKL